MRLDRLEIGGFLHFKDTAVLDLRNVPHGLVAVVGPNGHGKTRLLDAGLGSLYGPGAQTQAFPSREGPLAEYATDRDAHIETLWDLGGKSYRIRVNVDGVKRNTDAVIGEDLHGYGDFYRPLNDGKTSTFKEEVAKLFPSKRQVLASAFAAQGRQGSFVSLDNKGKMDLFSEMLALGHYAEKLDTARRCATAAEKARAALQAVIASMERSDTPEHQDLPGRQNAAVQNLNTSRTEQALNRALVQQLEAERDAHVETAQHYMAALAELVSAEQEEKRLTQVLAQLDTAAGAMAAKATTARHQAKQRLAETEKALSVRADAAKAHHGGVATSLDLRVAKCTALLAQADAIRAAVQAKRDGEAALAEARAAETKAREVLRDTQTRHEYAQKCLAFLDTAEKDLAAAHARVAIVGAVPCGGQGEYASCEFLRDAALAQAKIPALEAVVDGGNREVAQQAAEIAQQRRDAGAATIEASLRVQEIEAAARDPLADQEPALLVAEERIAACVRERAKAEEDLRARLDDLDDQRLASQVDQADADRDICADRDAQLKELAASRYQAVEGLAGVAERLAEARQRAEGALEGKGKLDDANARLRASQARLEAIAATVARREAQVEELARLQAAHAARLAQAVEARQRLAEADGELVGWQLLARACGRDGLPKLEVDAAGPTVSSLCNDLLGSCYGTQFTVEVVTQVARADGKGLKEQFDLSVFDNHHGGEPRSVSDLSGGERVIVEEALRGAIALFVNARNAHPIRTCWRDETTGALYPETVPLYVAMLRRIQQLGGFDHVLFITHNAEAAALADAQVRVFEGQPTVVLPPYREAA